MNAFQIYCNIEEKLRQEFVLTCSRTPNLNNIDAILIEVKNWYDFWNSHIPSNPTEEEIMHILYDKPLETFATIKICNNNIKCIKKCLEDIHMLEYFERKYSICL
jgi:hypothetical protein